MYSKRSVASSLLAVLSAFAVVTQWMPETVTAAPVQVFTLPRTTRLGEPDGAFAPSVREGEQAAAASTQAASIASASAPPAFDPAASAKVLADTINSINQMVQTAMQQLGVPIRSNSGTTATTPAASDPNSVFTEVQTGASTGGTTETAAQEAQDDAVLATTDILANDGDADSDDASNKGANVDDASLAASATDDSSASAPETPNSENEAAEIETSEAGSPDDDASLAGGVDDTAATESALAGSATDGQDDNPLIANVDSEDGDPLAAAIVSASDSTSASGAATNGVNGNVAAAPLAPADGTAAAVATASQDGAKPPCNKK